MNVQLKKARDMIQAAGGQLLGLHSLYYGKQEAFVDCSRRSPFDSLQVWATKRGLVFLAHISESPEDGCLIMLETGNNFTELEEFLR